MNTHLWNQIQAFNLDDIEAGLKFSDRLARENAWSETFTHRVIHEYKRFLFLCAEAGHAVTPSDAVDQVWHLHLCYTDSYWNDLCRKTLGFPLHHGPTKGGMVEREKFSTWYQKTLDSYENLFEERPPEDIWPQPKVRFKLQNFKRIDCSSNFVIPKQSVTQFASISFASFGLVGCTSLLAASDHFTIFWIITGIIFLGIIITIIKKGGGSGGGSSGGCGWFGGGCGGDSGCGGGCGS